jgi:4-hydroxybenzoyl-CoA thioesterase/acyl-CoA thioester hydrolase
VASRVPSSSFGEHRRTINQQSSPIKQTSPFSVRERVRWSDCDPFGIIYYGAYIRFFEIAEHELLRSLDLPKNLLGAQRDVWIPRKALTVDFLRPAQMDDEIDIAVSVGKLGTTSITYRFEVTRVSNGDRLATASLTAVCVDKATMTKKPLPDWFRARLGRALLVPEEHGPA